MNYPTIISNDTGLRDLAMAVARNRVGPNDPIEDVLAAHTTSPTAFARIVEDPVFRQYVKGFVREFSENGFSFAAKCKVLAEEAIEDIYVLVKDTNAPAASRVKALENLVDWAGLAPKQQAADPAVAKPTFSISINLPASVSATPLVITNALTPAIEVEYAESYDE